MIPAFETIMRERSTNNLAKNSNGNYRSVDVQTKFKYFSYGFKAAIASLVQNSLTAEDYLRDKYGAYRGHHEWRALEDAFNAGKAAQTQQKGSKPFIPTESQILAATEKAGLWPNTVYTWLPAFHRYHAELAKLQSQPESKEPESKWMPIKTAPVGERR